MKLNPRHRVAGLSLCLLLTALVVPAAQATRPDDRAQHGVGAISAQTTVVPDAFERAVASHLLSSDIAIPDAFERAAIRAQVTRPDDRASSRGLGSLAAPSSGAVTTSDGLSWDDALFGASAMLGLCLLAAAGALVATRRRSRVALR